MTNINDAVALEEALSVCERDPNVRLLRRVSPLDGFPLKDRGDGPTRQIALIDVETTGTDPLVDQIIDIAVVIVEINALGEIADIVKSGQALRDPGIPIPAPITKLTGLTDEDVAGKSVDLDRLERLIASADIRIAHNCRFDAAFLEALMPHLTGAAWACSANDFDWGEAGFDGAKLGHLLMQAGYFNGAHRAMADVVSLLHLLAYRLQNGRTVLSVLLERAERPSIRIEATGAPYDRRSQLKARGYRWDPVMRCWWIEVREEDEAAETLWLQREITPWGPAPRTRRIDWHERHR